MKAFHRPWILGSALILFSGCFSTGFEPLPRRAVLAQSLARRSGSMAAEKNGLPPGVDSIFDAAWSRGSTVFASLLQRLRHQNPEIRKAWATYSAALRIVAAGAPWDDPELELNPGMTAEKKPGFGGTAGIRITIPVGGHLGRTRAFLAEKASATLTEARAVEREQAFALRAAYVHVLASQAAMAVARENFDWAKKGTLLAERIARAGGASAVDVQVVATEERAARLALLEASNRLADHRAELGRLLILSPSALPLLPAIEGAPPKAPPFRREELLNRMLEHAPELARIEAEYRVAGRGLDVERAKRIPDLVVGVEAGGEDGEGVTFGLPLTFALPFWNANREGVAEARAEVAMAREMYRAGVDRTVAAVEILFDRLKRLETQLKVLDEEILPSHRTALQAARRAMEVSDFDPLQYVELERAKREWQESRVEVLGEILTTRIELERSVGIPLFPLPGKSPGKEKKK